MSMQQPVGVFVNRLVGDGKPWGESQCRISGLGFRVSVSGFGPRVQG